MNQKQRVYNQFIHSKNRFYERYGKILRKDQYDNLCSDVQKGYCQPIAKVSNAVSVFKSGEWFFVYDRRRHSIMTFLTEDMIDGYLEKERLKQKKSKIQKKTGNKGNLTSKQCDEIYHEMLSKFNVDTSNK